MRSIPIAVMASLAAGGAAQAQPQAPSEAPAASVSANVTLASQYVSRGFRQTWGKPALQGGADYVHPSGFSVGTWLSTVSNRFIENGTLEWDVYGGYSSAVGELGWSALLYYYKYPGAKYTATGTSYDYGELSLGATYKLFYAKYNHTYTADFFGITHARGTGYLDLGANIDLGAGLTLLVHAGSGKVRGEGNAIWNWRDYKLGLGKQLPGGWALAGAYTRADAATGAYDNYTLGIPNSAGIIETSNPGQGSFVLQVTKTF